MRGYAASICPPADLAIYERAVEMVEQLAEAQTHDCHFVAGYVGGALGLSVVRGYYGGIEHSWVALPSGRILDVYAVGRIPMVQVVDVASPAQPEYEGYRMTLAPFPIHRVDMPEKS